MRRLSQIGILFLAVGCQGLTPGFALENEGPSARSEVQQDVQTQSPTSPSRFVNIEGTLKEIQGDVYVLEADAAKEPIRIQIGRDTAFPNGQKEPGQSIQALVTSNDGHALIIR